MTLSLGDKLAIAAIVVVGLVTVGVWAAWPSINKWKSHEVVMTVTNTVATTQTKAVNDVVKAEARRVVHSDKISSGAQVAAARTRVPSSDTYREFIAGVCDTGVYQGYAECVGVGGQPAGGDPTKGGGTVQGH